MYRWRHARGSGDNSSAQPHVWIWISIFIIVFLVLPVLLMRRSRMPYRCVHYGAYYTADPTKSNPNPNLQQPVTAQVAVQQPATASVPARVAVQQPATASVPAQVAVQQPVTASVPAQVAVQQPVTASVPAQVAVQQPVTASVPAQVAKQPATASNRTVPSPPYVQDVTQPRCYMDSVYTTSKPDALHSRKYLTNGR